MAEPISNHAVKRYAVVTGGNKGIGFETCRQLASQGIMVILTARDEKKGIEAFEKLNSYGLSENLVFHQLDVVDEASIAALFEFVKSKFGKLDILVNNAGIGGLILEGDTLLLKEIIERDAVKASVPGYTELKEAEVKANGTLIETHKLAEQCLQANYYGAKGMIEAFMPLLQLSPSPRIVNVASFLGKLKLLSNEWAKAVLSDAKNLTEERIEEVINQFLADFKNGEVQTKGWPSSFIAYKVSKAAMIAYTRIIANKYPSFRINSVCPGYVSTDINANTGPLTAAEGAESLVMLALLPDNGPSGLFFFRKEVTTF